MSSSKAEYRSIAHVVVVVTWLVRLLDELGVANSKLVILHYDNQSCVSRKYIDIDCYFIREKRDERLATTFLLIRS